MKNFLFSFLVLLFLLTSYSIGEPKSHRGGAATKAAPKEAVDQEKVRDTVDQGRVRGEVKKGLTAEVNALEAERKNNWEEATRLYNQASNGARLSGQLQKAISYGQKAAQMAEKAGDPALQARAILRLSFALKDVGQDAKAMEWLQKGIGVAKQIPQGNKEAIEAQLYRELGLGFLRQGEAGKAVDYISYSLQALDARLTFVQSRKRRQKGLRPVQKTQKNIVDTLDRLGAAYQRVGKVEEAMKAYERGLSIIKEAGLKTPTEGKLYVGLGEVYLGQKDFPHAQKNLNRALKMGERLQDTTVIQRASTQIGNLFLQTQRPLAAIPYYKKAIDTVESTRSLLESEEFRTTFFEDKGQIYGGIILAHIGAKNVEEAFNYAERARSRAFLDILGSRVQLTRQGELLEEERALQARIGTLKAKLADQGREEKEEEEEEEGEEGEKESDRKQLQQELEAAQKAYTDFLAKVRKEDKEQASLMNVEPLTLKQVQELLDPGVTMLEYFVVRQAVLLWVVEKDRFRFVRIPLARTELVEKVSSLRDTIFQVGERERFRGYSEGLYKLLIEPALPHIRGKELLIIPHDVLHYLPYQALISDKGNYLIQDYPIYYLSSASLMQFTREKRRASKEGKEEKALVMGNPSLGDEAYNLRFAEREAKEIARVYPKSTVYLRSEATKPRAVSLSPNYDILHFAVHGEFDQDDPLSSGLLLAAGGKGDGKLKASEIFSLNLKADTVALSACETGLGKITNGDEIIGLTRAFIYAGTPSVITTLWKVNDRASYELMREFYTNLKTKKKAESLRQAQLKIMKEFPHPFFWAAYGLTGEP